MNRIISSLVITLALTVQGSNITIWAPSMPPGWPVVLAPDIPSSIQLSNKAKFSWEFPGEKDVKCTINGLAAQSPCVGRVVDRFYAKTGTYKVKLVITDSSLKTPLTIERTVDIVEETSFPKAQRAELRQLSDDQWSIIVNGLYRLKSLGVYDHVSRVHKQSFNEIAVANAKRGAAHRGPSFLPWHRMLNRVMERYLQEATGYPRLGMPYWSWLEGWKGLDKYLGPSGRSSDKVVESGPFCNVKKAGCPQRWPLPDDVKDGAQGLKREIGADASFHFLTQKELDNLMSIPNYDLSPFDGTGYQNSFRNALEGWITEKDLSFGHNHNGIHRWMGGHMSDVRNSFNDPSFLFHHCEVDRLFGMWQKKHGCDDGHGSATCYRPGDKDPDVNMNLAGSQLLPNKDGEERYAIKGSMFFDVMFPWGLQVNQLLKADVGYEFLDSSPDFGDKQEKKEEPKVDEPKDDGKTNNMTTDGKNGNTKQKQKDRSPKGNAVRIDSSFALIISTFALIIAFLQ